MMSQEINIKVIVCEEGFVAGKNDAVGIFMDLDALVAAIRDDLAIVQAEVSGGAEPKGDVKIHVL